MKESTAAKKIQISKNGPYVVSGDLPLSKEAIGVNQGGESVEWAHGAGYPRQAQYALCRCGHSANKPFCDGTHKKIGFDGTETASRKPYLEQAKASPEVLLYPMLRKRKGFEIRDRSHVLGLNYDRHAKQVTGVRYVDRLTGQEYEQPADVVVLAAFTMTNAKLLLLDHIGKAYNPATRQGVVGKNFCYQANSGVSLFMKDRWINPFLAAGSTQIYMDDFNNDNFDHTGLGFLGGGGIGASVFNGRPIASRHLPPGTPRWGSDWKKANVDWYAHSFSLGIQGSCYPHTENFLDLDPVYKDAYGQPLVRMTFDWRDNEMKMSQHVTQKMDDIAKSIGADIVGPAKPRKSPFDTRVYQSTHIVGGTVMGADPHTSVVSPHLQHWDAHNLFVVGASVYPHNSGYNPTGPLSALALRLGDDLVQYTKRPRMFRMPRNG